MKHDTKYYQRVAQNNYAKITKVEKQIQNQNTCLKPLPVPDLPKAMLKSQLRKNLQDLENKVISL